MLIYAEEGVIVLLTENEWNAINNILLELYTIDAPDKFINKIMKFIKMLIPYTKGWFIILNDDQEIIGEKSYFTGFDKSSESKYINFYYQEDYIKYLYDFTSETSVYRDTNILEKDIREKTDFYIEFLKPENIVFGCGIILIKNSRIIGIFNLFRNEDAGDFNKKEIYILNVLKKHIENILYNITQLSCVKMSIGKSIDIFSSEYHLTVRETEILKLINKGYSNREISDKFVISLSTTKKHIYNLYNKTGVSSRSQLISLFLDRG